MHGGYNSIYEKQKPVLWVHGVYEHDSARIFAKENGGKRNPRRFFTGFLLFAQNA